MTTDSQTDVARLTERVRAVMETVTQTDETFRANYRSGLTTFPIPFFGNLHTAKVLTIGVNPSAGEFVHRNWPAQMDSASLTQRLLHYFDSPPGPHPWFVPWIEALALLDIDYRRGEAAHLDLSPRATVSMSAVPNPELFLQMVSQDLRWLFEFLQECNSARLLMAAGTVTKRWYLHQFLASDANHHRLAFQPKPKSSDRCTLHEVTHTGRKLPLFFSSVSPSDSKRAHLLVENVRKTRDQLRDYLN